MMAVSSIGKVQPEGVVDGEFSFTTEDFRTIARMLQTDAGIALPPSKATLAYSRLTKRLRALQLRSFNEYCELLSSPDGRTERDRMVSALTTNVTRFFREPHHFEYLRSEVLPRLLDECRKGRRVRLWSAACSTGQEPYSLALTLVSLAPDIGRLDVRILATDIDASVLVEARRGCYSDAALGAVPTSLRQQWFAPTDSGEWRVSSELQRLVTFRELNLTAPNWPMRVQFQAVLCRNVAIYFNEQTQATLWSQLGQRIEHGGYLYIGHSERIIGEATRLFRNVGITIYRRFQENEQ